MKVFEANVLNRICRDLIKGDDLSDAGFDEMDRARRWASTLSATQTLPQVRRLSVVQRLQIFQRDGFKDRYSGEHLVFPGTLRLLSHIAPEAIPYRANWLVRGCHPVYLRLCPTLNNVTPFVRRVRKGHLNLVTTSVLHDAQKANFSIEELGWTLLQPTSEPSWDGLTTWFIRYVETHDTYMNLPSIQNWYRAARTVYGQ